MVNPNPDSGDIPITLMDNPSTAFRHGFLLIELVNLPFPMMACMKCGGLIMPEVSALEIHKKWHKVIGA